MATIKKNSKNVLKINKSIIFTGKILEKASPKLAALFAIRLFTTPIRYKTPKREKPMDMSSRQELLFVPSLNKRINTYHMGSCKSKVLLVHGWSGRGTQMYSIADALLKNQYSVISFDAPAHGKSDGSKSEMTQFITCITYLTEVYGPFTYAVGHSLGAMALLNAVKEGLSLKRVVIISSGNVIRDIMYDFIGKLGMGIATGDVMINRLEKKLGQTIDSYSAYIAAQHITIPILICHDENDTDVSIDAAIDINNNMKCSELLITKGLGHRKILGDKNVIQKIVEFLK